MKRILFAPETLNLAEVTRALEVANAIRNEFDIHFTSYGGKYESAVREAGFTVHSLSPRLTEEKIEHLYQVDRCEKFAALFTDEELAARVEGEVALFKELRPAAVVTGACVSIPVSTRVAQVPLVWLIGSPWISPYFEAGKGTWPDMLDYWFLRWAPDRVLNWLSNKMMPWFVAGIVRPFNRTARRYGVKEFTGYDFFEGDYPLLTEPPEFAGLSGLPPRYRYIGPLIARLDAPIPDEVANLPRDKPIVWFAMGSSGAPDIVAGIIEGFRGRPYRVIAPVRSLIKKLNVNAPPNVITTDLLPAHKVNPMADISVIHGGIGTVMTACLSGTPVVGVGMQPEQEANLECLVRKGFAIRIRKKRLTPQRVLDAVDRLLGDAEARRKAREFQRIVEQWDGPANAARFFRETFG
jgi:UDP:flavonoid glycosyltransferase YjiC (YdhE family)